MTATPMLVLHIGAGTLGLLSGTAALFLRKGSLRHRTAGKLFVVSMLCMAASASVLAYALREWSNVLGGITTAYFVTTAWMTLKRGAGEVGRFEIVAFFVVVAGISANVALGLAAASSETGLIDGFPPGHYYFFAGLLSLFAIGDLRLILRGGISGSQRLARHLIRMCYAVFIAAGSLFLGQMQVFPELLRETHLLFVLPFVPLVMMMFWLFRVRLRKWDRKVAVRPARYG